MPWHTISQRPCNYKKSWGRFWWESSTVSAGEHLNSPTLFFFFLSFLLVFYYTRPSILLMAKDYFPPPPDLQVATACALAAFKLRRPVKMYLDRQTDIVMMGGRHPMKINYDVGFKSDGKITALHVDMLINAGITNDASPFIPLNTVTALKKYNWGALSFDIKLCKTNVSTKSAMRGPGEVQGSYIAEAIIQDVASFLSMDSHSVKKKNLHTYDSLKLFYPVSAGDVPEYTLPSIVDDLTSSARYSERLEKVQRFNGFNKWRKRGISWVPVIYQVMQMSTPGKVSILDDGSIVIEVGGIELGQGLWTKVKQMAAFSLGQLWGDGSQNLLDKARVVQADTLSLIQGGITSGSTTSESSCAAVRESCKILADRLKSVKENLEAQMGSVSWDNLIVQVSHCKLMTQRKINFVGLNILKYGHH